MATIVQQILQAPLLLSVACWHREIDASKNGDIPWLIKELETAYKAKFSKQVNDFRNESLYAKKQLEAAGYLKISPRRSWRVTDAGMRHLRDLLSEVLSALSLEGIKSLVFTKCDGYEWWLVVLKALDNDDLSSVVRNPQSDCALSLFKAAIRHVSDDELEYVLVAVYEELFALFFEHSGRLRKLSSR